MLSTDANPHTTPPQFEDADVRAVLESFRKADHLGDTPLRQLVAVWARLDPAGPPTTPHALDTVLEQLLAEIVSDNLDRLRSVEGLAEPEDTRVAQEEALARDFMQGSAELESWSVLHYRYIRRDLNLRGQDVSAIANIHPRQLRRRTARGVRLLTETLSEMESAARAENRQLAMWLKLPPAGYGDLFGIETALADLVERLATPGPPWLVVVRGSGGLGKSTLAHAALRRLVGDDTFGDLAWLGLDEPASYPTLLARIARELGYPHLAETPLADLERSLRVLLSDTQTVLVLDNAEHLDDLPLVVERLAALVQPGKLLLTIRRWPGSETPAHVLTLNPLPREAIAALIQRMAGEHAIAQAEHLSGDELGQLYDVIGGNPLAARLVAGQLARLPLARVLDNPAALHTDRGLPLFDALFARTWESLGDEARQLALVLPLVPPEGAFWDDLFLLAGLPETALDTAITELTSSAFLEALGPAPRYAIHHLTRRYLEQTVTQPENAPVFERLLGQALSRALALFEDESDAESAPGRKAAAWLQLLRWGAEQGVESDLLSKLVTHVAPGVRRSGQWERWVSVLERARLHLPDEALGRIHLETGVALRWLGEVNGSADALEEAIAGFGERGDFVAQAEALIELGALYAGSGHMPEAVVAYRRAVAAAERFEEYDSLRRALNGLATLAMQDDAVEEALVLLRQALELAPDRPDPQTLSNLGQACLSAGRVEEAIRFQQEALAGYELAADLPNQARAHVRLASAYLSGGDYDDTRRHFEEGLALMRALGDALGQARTLANLGTAHRQEGRWNDAMSVWRDAMALQRHLGDQSGMAVTWYNLGDAQWTAGNEHAARQSLAEATRLAEAAHLSSLVKSIAEHPASLT